METISLVFLLVVVVVELIAIIKLSNKIVENKDTLESTIDGVHKLSKVVGQLIDEHTTLAEAFVQNANTINMELARNVAEETTTDVNMVVEEVAGKLYVKSSDVLRLTTKKGYIITKVNSVLSAIKPEEVYILGEGYREIISWEKYYDKVHLEGKL